MPIPNLTELEYFTRFVYKSDAPKLITLYLDGPDSTKYDAMQTSLRSILSDTALTDKVNLVAGKVPRIVITNVDADVIFDSSVDSSGNTHTLATAKTINSSNHFSRMAIAKAMQSNAGIGNQVKLSGTTGNKEIRQSTRLGKSNDEIIGVISVSIVVP